MLILWLVALHVIGIIAWMAALLYLPRLFVYHAEAAPGSETSETFKVMERRLLRAIGTPAMLATWILGPTVATLTGAWDEPWLHVKLACVLGLTAAHGLQAKWMKAFARDENERDARFYRIANEVPTVLMIAIVVLVIVKPF